MIVLDTDHVTVLRYEEDSRYPILTERLKQSDDERLVVSVITVEEQMRGWLSENHGLRDIQDQIEPYNHLAEMIEFLTGWEIIRLDQFATAEYARMQKQKIRVAPQDLKIASIALSNNALLLSANLKDYEKVPGLRVENWLE